MRKFTSEQINAVSARGGTVLVSAAAGSGKTTVLVRRILECILYDTNPTPANKLLIVTFTRAAAAEMRTRLNRELTELIRSKPNDKQLRHQQFLLQSAKIGTIHSFCGDCLREYAVEAGISSDFRIADTSEIKVIRAEVIENLLEEKYESDDHNFHDLFEYFVFKGNDKELVSAILKTADYVSSFLDPHEKLRELGCIVTAIPEETKWGQVVLDFVLKTLEYLKRKTESDLQIIKEDKLLFEKYYVTFSEDYSLIEILHNYVIELNWDALYSALQNCSFLRLPSIPKDACTLHKEALQDSRKETKKLLESLAGIMCGSQADFLEDMTECTPLLKSLCDITSDFLIQMEERKRELSILEYDDLEHITAALLCDNIDGKYVKSTVARDISNKYDYIFIDEYQDTNAMQDLIFRAISHSDDDIISDGNNLFLVGDIKQSIYGFRGANPDLFLTCDKNYSHYNADNPKYPAKIALSKNFRSRPEVIDAINHIFSRLMCIQNGGIDYADGHELVAGIEFPISEGMESELHLICGDDGSDQESNDIIESRYCANLILNMIDSNFMVTDKDQMRAARPGDFCILRRSIGGAHGDAFISEFRKYGFEVSITTDKGFFQTSEINIILSFLQAINNPLSDISLLGALRSPIWSFDCDDLVRIKLKSSGSVYSGLRALAEEGDEKADKVLCDLAEYRSKAATQPCHKLISSVYHNFHLTSFVSMMSGGEARSANLRLFAEIAENYENNTHKGLSGFLRMIGKLIREGANQPCAPANISSELINIKTIHGAKGLEFPIIILTGMAAAQNTESLKGAVVYGDSGIGMKIRDNKRMSEQSTLMREAAILERREAETNEELRVLYVALTRAVDKLIMVTSGSSANKMKSSARTLFVDHKIDPFAVRISPSFGKWVLACAMLPDSPIRIIEWKSADLICSDTIDENASFKSIKEETVDFGLVEEIRNRFGFSINCEGSKSFSKVTASDINAANLTYSSIASKRPNFVMNSGISAAEKGTATHKFMQFANLHNASIDIISEIEFLVNKRFLSRKEAESIDINHVSLFFESRAWEMIKSADKFRREWRFSSYLPNHMAHLFPDLTEKDDIILQGECDCLIEKDGEVFIIDYKTDRGKTAEELAEHYSAQLRLYAAAAEQVLGLPVKGCYVYSFNHSRLIEVG